MTLVSLGAISMGDINVELGRARTVQISLDTAENGSYVAINQNSSSKPSSTNPATISEWRGYNHLAVASSITITSYSAGNLYFTISGTGYFPSTLTVNTSTTSSTGPWINSTSGATSPRSVGVPIVTTWYRIQDANTPSILSNVYQQVVDSLAPSVPTNVLYTYYDTLSGDDDLLTWTASTDNVGVTSYDVYVTKDGSALTNYNVTSFLNCNYNYFSRTYGDGFYEFKVRAKDGAGNVSALSAPYSITMLSQRIGAHPTSLYTSSITSTSFVLNWASSSIASIGGYKIFKNGVLLTTVGNVMGYAVTGLTASTGYNFTVQTIESGTSYLSQMSNNLSMTTSAADSTAPSTPALYPLNYDDSSPEIWFSWSTSTDVSGIAYYEISRTSNGVGFMIIDTSTVTDYNDMDIFYGNTYYYKIRAVDNAGNVGAFSNQRSRTASVPVDPYCFVEGTLITLDSGLQVPVETLVIKQSLLSSQIDTLIDTNDKTELFEWSTDVLIENRVLSSVVSNEKFVSNQTIIINNGLLEATYSHGQLIMRDNIWRFVNFKDMVCGDYLYDDHSNLVEIKDITLNFEPRNVYKLLLSSKSHMYFANKILTHNPVLK